MRLSDLAEIKATNSNIDNLFDYFNNKDFENVNKDRCFTPMEQIAIIIHSDAPSISLERKFKDLRELATRVDDDIKEEIEYYIDSKQKMVEFVKSLNDDRFMFHIPYGGRVSNPKIFRTYEDALKEGCAIPVGITIEKLFADSKEQYPQGNCGYINFVTVGCLDNEIADINISGELYLMANLPKRHLKINDVIVKLNSPFQPFDLMELPLNRCYYIVADVDEDEMNKLTEENNKSKFSSRKPYDWLQLDVPFYDEQYDGTIETRCINYFRFAIGQIKRVPIDDMKLRTYEHIKELREKICNK